VNVTEDETHCAANYITPHNALRPKSGFNALGRDMLNIIRGFPAK